MSLLVRLIWTNRLVTWARTFIHPLKAARTLETWWRGEFSAYLSSCQGVIHVGANSGQERDLYASHDLRVAWVEAIPELYEELERSIAGYPKQRAVKALATDKDGDSHVIHVASNHGASSSILELHQHRDIWPDIEFVRDIELESSTLPTALSRVGLDPSHYDALIVDTQGSELMVLRGAEPLFPHLTHIQVEAADFEPYKGCATVAGLCTFLSARGFRLVRKKKTATHPDGGRYFDLLFRNSACLRY